MDTPLEPADGDALEADVVVVPVLRAGLGMVEAVLELHPARARRPHRPAARRTHGGRVAVLREAAARPLEQHGPRRRSHARHGRKRGVGDHRAAGAPARSDIRLLCIVAAPEGIAAVEAAHPSVHIYTPVVDRELNAQKFILPGLGDFGDRLYGTL